MLRTYKQFGFLGILGFTNASWNIIAINVAGYGIFFIPLLP